MKKEEPYNPLNKRHLGESVADALLLQEKVPLGKIESFDGAGIYAIYYSGDFEAYQPIVLAQTSEEHEMPIYVGKAVPPGARKGLVGLDAATKGALYKRLNEHSESIQQTPNLNIEDFTCRYLVVDDIWIPLGESLLIARFSPIWNQLIDGFGNHDPGSGRYKQERSRWDTLHPGRSWAIKCQERKETSSQIISEIKSFLRIMS